MVGFMKGLGCGCCQSCDFEPEFTDDFSSRSRFWTGYTNAVPPSDLSTQIPFTWDGDSVFGRITNASNGHSNNSQWRGKSGTYLCQFVQLWMDGTYPVRIVEQFVDVTLERPLPGYNRTSPPYFTPALGYGHGGAVGVIQGLDYITLKDLASLTWTSGKLLEGISLPYTYSGALERITFNATCRQSTTAPWVNHSAYPIAYGPQGLQLFSPFSAWCNLELFNDLEYEAILNGAGTITRRIGFAIEFQSVDTIAFLYYLDGALVLSKTVVSASVATTYRNQWLDSTDCNASVFLGVSGGVTELISQGGGRFDYGHWYQDFGYATQFGSGPMIHKADFDNYTHSINAP